MVVLEKRKVTVYVLGMFGYSAFESSAYEVHVGPYAQYTHAVHVAFVPKGKRKARGTVKYSYSDRGCGVLVLDGHGHPTPANPFKSTPGGGEITRRMSCDVGWETEFDAMMNAYIAESGATVLADYRKPYSEAA